RLVLVAMTRNLASTMGRFLVLLALSSSAILAQPVAVSAAGPIGGWVAGPPMAGPRDSHTVTTLKDGRILVVGGGAEIYDPKTDAWSAAASLPAPRTGHTATLLPDGRVLVAGGTNGSGVLATAAIYDPAANKWAPGPSMTMPRRGSLSTRLRDSRVLVVGGLEFPGPAQVAAEIFDPKTES